MNNIEIFKSRLAETITWCTTGNSLNDPALSLRSSILRPPSLRLSNRFKIELQNVVNALAEERAQCMRSWNYKEINPAQDLAGGQLLLCTSATESIPDGGVSSSSRGFYDEDDLPPWDTWICYLIMNSDDVALPGWQYQKEYLVSWVPEVWVDLAKIGVEEHFLDCMSWASQVEIPFTRQLREAGLIN